jgi:hypothetical protein
MSDHSRLQIDFTVHGRFADIFDSAITVFFDHFRRDLMNEVHFYGLCKIIEDADFILVVTRGMFRLAILEIFSDSVFQRLALGTGMDFFDGFFNTQAGTSDQKA